jgi:uncharacterized protein DUF4013
MNNWQELFLFPVRDAEARKQFLIACLVTLAGFIIPILPGIMLLGYGAKIMREIINERKVPAMPDWQGSDFNQMLIDGLRLFGLQIVLMLPLFILMGCGFTFIMGGSISMGILSDERTSSLAPIGLLLLMLGVLSMMLFVALSFPYGVIISAALPHAVANNSFSAGLNFKEWFAIFRKGFANFLLGYVFIMVVSFVFVFVLQFAMITIILICLVPFIMIPYSTYLVLVSNTIYAQAYVLGRDALNTVQLEPNATA